MLSWLFHLYTTPHTIVSFHIQAPAPAMQSKLTSTTPPHQQFSTPNCSKNSKFMKQANLTTQVWILTEELGVRWG